MYYSIWLRVILYGYYVLIYTVCYVSVAFSFYLVAWPGIQYSDRGPNVWLHNCNRPHTHTRTHTHTRAGGQERFDLLQKHYLLTVSARGGGGAGATSGIRMQASRGPSSARCTTSASL